MMKFGISVLLLVSIVFRTINCEPRIVIVGAGPSGIAAATRLLRNNFTNLVILEAEERIGGRIKSVKFGDAFVEIGAEWCHGENIVYDMVKDMNVISLRHELREQLISHYSNGKTIPDKLKRDLFKMIDDIYSNDANRKEGQTLGDYCKQEFTRRVSQLNITDPIQLRFVKDFVPFFEYFTLTAEGAFSWLDPSAVSDFHVSKGRLDWTWSGLGYKTILDILMQKFPKSNNPLPIDDKFLLNKEVQKVHWNDGSDTATVVCQDNSTYNADYVVFTPSLGVLKAQHKDMFEPGLPIHKANAIKNIGFGAVMKILLHYKQAWWPVDDEFFGFSFIWAEEHRNSEHFQLNDKSWLLALAVMSPVQSNPNVISLWFLGPNVPKIEMLDENVLLEGIDYGLNLFLGHQYNISHPESFIRSNWHSNPHFRGTYSYQTIASRKTKSNVHLGEPLMNQNGKDIVLFAGESTNPIHFSTVHGAIETGYREADRIIKLHNKEL